MNTYRATAVIVGVLFITATVTAIAGLSILGSTLDEPGYLTALSANENQVTTAALFELILAVSLIVIGFMMYPILKRVIESLALAYALLRLAEAVFIVIATTSLLSLLTLSQDFVAVGADAALYLPSGSLLMDLRDWAIVFGTLIFLGLGGLPLYYLLFKANLVPRWLSSWGLVGAALIFFTGILALFGLDPASNTTTILAAPIAVQEMVFALWLIIRGFNAAAVSALAAG